MITTARAACTTRTRLLFIFGRIYFYTDSVHTYFDSDGAVQRLPPPATANVVDTTGAGDAFVGAFCHGLASGLPEVDAVKLGMACASDSVTREGTQASFPTRERCKALGILS